MKRLFPVLVWLVLAALPLASEQVSELKHNDRAVNDFANVLSPEDEAKIEELSTDLWQSHHVKLSLATINSLEGRDIESFANDLFRQWGVGGKDDRGVLILLVIKDRKYRMEVGYGLEPVLPDGKSGSIGREAIPFLKKAEYGNAAVLMAKRVAEAVVPAPAAESAAEQTNGEGPVSGEAPQGVLEYPEERSALMRAWDWVWETPLHLFITFIGAAVVVLPVRKVYRITRGTARKVTANVPAGKDPKKQIPNWFLIIPVLGFFTTVFVLSILELDTNIYWFALFIGAVATWVVILRRMLKSGWWIPQSGTVDGKSWDSTSSSSSSWSSSDSSSSSSSSGYDGGSSGGGGSSGNW